MLKCNTTRPVTWSLLDEKKVISKRHQLIFPKMKHKLQGNYICKGMTDEGYTFRGFSLLAVYGMLKRLPYHSPPKFQSALLQKIVLLHIGHLCLASTRKVVQTMKPKSTGVLCPTHNTTKIHAFTTG